MYDAEPSKPNDISWLTFLFFAGALIVTAWLFDEMYRPMTGIDLVEKVLWYVGYGAAYLLIPGLPVLLIHSISRRKGNGLTAPKRVTVIVGVGLMALTSFLAVIRIAR